VSEAKVFHFNFGDKQLVMTSATAEEFPLDSRGLTT